MKKSKILKVVFIAILIIVLISATVTTTFLALKNIAAAFIFLALLVFLSAS